MRRVLLALLVAGCTAGSPQEVRVQKTLAVICKVDAVAQPVIVGLVPAIGPAGVAAAAADNLLVHPAVVAACASVHGEPAAVVIVAPVVPVAAPVSPDTPSVSGIPAP